VYVADGAGDVVVKITASGVLSIVAGTGQRGAPTPGPATQSSLADPSGVAVDAAGDVYIADPGNDVIEKVTPSGVLSIVAGTGRQGAPTPGPATASDLGRPVAITLGPTGDLYIADQLNREVEEVTPQGVLSIVAGILHHHGEITPGPARRSQLDGPVAVAVNAAGELYIADLPCYCVEQVTPAGVISVIAGSVAVTRPGADQARLNTFVYPQGLALGRGGDLYVASTQAGVILKLADALRAESQGPPTIAASPMTVHGSEITQTFSCVSGTGRCVLAATLRTSSGGRRALTLAHRQLTIPVGSFRTLTLAADQTGKRLLQANRVLRTSLTITASRPTRLTRSIQGILFAASLHRTVLLRSCRA
jgi:DNA-binding beta-propeller fold protein YncE